MSLRQRLPAPLKRALAPAMRAVRARAQARNTDPYQGALDGIDAAGVLRGWVFERGTGRGALPVGLYAGEALIETGTALSPRADVSNAHGADTDCGFGFALTDAMIDRARDQGVALSVRVLDDPPFDLGGLEMEADDGAALGTDAQRLAHVLRDDLDALLDALDGTPEDAGPVPDFTPPPLTCHAPLFSTEQVMPGVPESGLFGYLDYLRFRDRHDQKFEVEPGLEAGAHFLHWYVTTYRAHTQRRIPLSRGAITYLNEPMVMGGQAHSLTRIMWWRLAARPALLAQAKLGDRDAWLDLAYWWAEEDAPHLFFEDCLVPDRFADALRGVHHVRRFDAYPLSAFTERLWQRTPGLKFLRADTVAGRKALTMAVLVRAARRPDLLRYLPHACLEDALAPDADGSTALERFVADLIAARAEADAFEGTATPAAPRIDRDRFAHVLRARDFDLASRRFLTVSREGHRFEAAALPRPTQGREVDVQLIGPLAKASGLGQATRLSADILRATGLDVRGVDFDLDNPAPEGFSSDTQIEPHGPAKVNLIHLNAEAIPLAFAYQPDVFSGRYNIGYFYWELDRPAFCHYLGLEMLDEIWVSTEFGVQVYTRPEDDHGLPVTNVGMCYEDLPDIEREDARAYVKRRFLFDDEAYVCLVAFDSFSFVQRKNPVKVLEAFQAAFADVPQARLVIKTHNRDSVFDTVQARLWERVDAIVAADPRIVVMNETLSYRDLLRLKAGSDCYVSLHKSEGWGFGMIEAMNLGLPVVCTAYSGNMDFCTPDTAWLVDYEMETLAQGDYIFVRPGSQWGDPDVDHAARQLRAAYDDPEARRAKAEAARADIRTRFSKEAVAERYGGRLREILAGLDGA